MIKSVLMSTTVLMSLAGMAQAEEFKVEVEGEVTFGANDRLKDHSYLVGEVEVSAGQTFSNGFGWALTYELEGEKFGWGNATDFDDKVLLELITPAGTLAYGDMNKKGASELFYNDLTGMGVDVVRYKDGYPSLRWRGTVGEGFSYAISTRNLNNTDDDEYSIGIGYKTDQYEIGLAYDNESVGQDEAWAATFVYNGKLGAAKAEYTLSYVDTLKGSSLGLGVEAEFDMGLTVEASYAFNDISGLDNGYGLSLEYKSGPLVAEAEYEYDGKAAEYELGLSYKIEDLAPEGTTLYAGYVYEEGSAADTGYYVGAGFGIAKNAVFGIAYSETDEGGDLEVQPGWNAMLTISF